MKYYIEAYGHDGEQILGNGDGQGIIHARRYERTNRYKALKNFPTLNNRVAYYLIVNDSGQVMDKVMK